MTIYVLMVGAVIAASLFASTLWSAQRSFATTGRTRVAHIILAALVIAAMATLSLELPLLSRIAGILLILAALQTGWRDARWSKLLALPPIIFGAVLAAGLPFSAS